MTHEQKAQECAKEIIPRNCDCGICRDYNDKARVPALKIILRYFPEPQEKVCSWVENDCGIYETDCKEAFQFEAGQRHDNRFKFCPYCGGKIV